MNRNGNSTLLRTADVNLHPELPFLTLHRLLHLWVALFLLVLCRRRRIDDRRVHDAAPAHELSRAFKIPHDALKHRFAQPAVLQYPAKLQQRRRIRRLLLLFWLLPALYHELTTSGIKSAVP